MIRLVLMPIGNSPPRLSIILAMDHSLVDQIYLLERYLVSTDQTGLEVIVAVVEGEPFRESPAKNAAASQASAPFLAFTNAGVYPPASLVQRSIAELEAGPDSLVLALRLDGLPDYGVFPNPWALGDWQCMEKGKFREVGGYDESMEQGGFIEYGLIARAVAAGCKCVLMDERVYHAYHASRFGEEYDARHARNKERVCSAGLPFPVVRYPDMWEFRVPGKSPQVACHVQLDGISSPMPHAPHHPSYWAMIAEGNAEGKVLAQSRTAVREYDRLISGIGDRSLADIRGVLPMIRDHACGRVLELGVRKGNSTTALLAGLEQCGGELWSVDIDPRCAAVWRGHPQWHFVWADSREEDRLLACGVPDELDLIFADSDHTCEHVVAELRTWAKHLDREGMVLLHDAEYESVARAVESFMAAEADWRYTVERGPGRPCGDVGVLRRQRNSYFISNCRTTRTASEVGRQR